MSVIVAAYNAEKIIAKCMDSLLRQSLPEVEIILVNDGSTDGTGAVCKEYAQKYRQVKAIDKANGGCGSARNAGAKISTGKYIGFADADDWVEPNMYEELYLRAESLDADIVMCDYFRERGQGTDLKKRIDPAFLKDAVFNKDTLHCEPRKGSFFGTVVCWNKIFRRSFYEENIHFPEEIAIAEDVPAIFKALSRAKRICVVERKFYHYNAVGTSNSRMKNRRVLGVFKAADMLISDMVKNDYGMFAGFVLRGVVNDAMHHFRNIASEYRRECMECFIKLIHRLEKEGFLNYLRDKDAFKVWCFDHLGFFASNIMARL